MRRFNVSALLLFGSLALHAQADPAARLGFTPDRASAEQVKRSVIARIAQGNPQAAQAVQRELAGRDVSAVFEQTVAPYGLHDGNLADAITAHDVMKRMRETNTPAPPAAEIQQLRENTARTLVSQPGAQTESKRREVAEIAQIGFLVEYLAWSEQQRSHAVAPAPSGATSGAATPLATGRAAEPAPAPAEASGTGTGATLPIGAATLSAGNFTPMGSTIHVEAWYLYPSGIAHNCSTHDPATLQISLGFLRSLRDCTGGRWRRAGGKVQIQQSDRDSWSDALPQPAQQPGTRIQFLGETAGGAGTMPGTAAVSVNTVDSGRLLLTADGHIRGVLSSGTAISGANVGGGASHASRLDGTYSIDGYVMTISANNQTFRRFVTVVHESGKVYVYFQGREYWPPGR